MKSVYNVFSRLGLAAEKWLITLRLDSSIDEIIEDETMQELVKSQTMSSLEIAQLVSIRHDSVKRSIERLMKSEIIQHSPAVDVKNNQGQTIKTYSIGKRDSYVLVAQLSPEFTGKLVDDKAKLAKVNGT